ncbi:outer membrane beta-barrel protein [uncultured Polaribacter sp.]|uniref:outer membrane beta-barrel protein n=1 Tax=uncultured Polaribacter sp. TaxID=174711 RepID=UPI00261E1A13|nr:outer membrane beta-barrel protein [uncultured Polaribacter sp.]
MQKLIFIFCLFLGFSQVANAQIDFGLKAGLNYSNNGNESAKTKFNDIVDGAEEELGYHAGIWFRGKLPILGFYIRPEIIYTQVQSEYALNTVNTNYDFKKIDVPVLIGKRFLRVVSVFIGPSFQYIIDDSFQLDNVTTEEFDKFSVGAQMGLGVEFGSLGIDVRWERGLSNTEANFTNNFTVDNRTNQLILGVSFKL